MKMQHLIIISIISFMVSVTSPLMPKQVQLLNEIEHGDHEWIGYGGARGGAKSHAIREDALYLGFKYNIHQLVFRRYRQELLDNHVYPLLKQYPFLRKYFNKSEMILYHPRTGNPMIKFGYAERVEDIYKEQGNQYQVIYIDEATQMVEEMIVWLSTSNRDDKSLLPSKAKMVLTMNPGGVGHVYVKRIFIDRVYIANEKPDNYYFIQSSVWDNVFWSIKELRAQGYTVNDYYYKWTDEERKKFTLKYSDYAKRLGSLPEELKLAYLFGDWNVFSGLFFKEFDVSRNVIEPFEIPAEWGIVGSLDPGFSSPLSFGLTARSFENKYYRIATYYNIDKIPNHAIAIKKWLSNENSPIYSYLKGRIPSVIVAGRDAFAKLDRSAIKSNDETVEMYFQNEGLHLMHGNDGAGTRIENWWTWKSLMPDRYFVFEGLNTPLIQQLTSVESDDKIVEDIKGRGNDPSVEDHALDEQKLGIASLFKPVKDEEEEQVSRPFAGNYDNPQGITSF